MDETQDPSTPEAVPAATGDAPFAGAAAIAPAPPPPPPAAIPAPVPVPVPIPIPIPVTSASRPFAHIPAGRDRTALILTLVAVFGLLLLAAAGFFVLLLLESPTGTPSTSGMLEVSTIERWVLDEYPDYTVRDIRPWVDAGTTQTPRGYVHYDVKLESQKHAGFVILVTYSAPAERGRDEDAYEYSDDFFTDYRSFEQPIDSFIAMWSAAYPGSTCVLVQEVAGSSETTRGYAVSYIAAGDIRRQTVYYGYNDGTDEWRYSTMSEVYEGMEDQMFPPPVEGSDPDTAALVARYFPGFEPYRDYRTSTGAWDLIIRSREHPGVLLAVDPDLAPYLSDGDAEYELFRKPSARSEAFLAAWEERYPGKVIEFMSLDPSMDGSTDTLGVYYAAPPEETPFLGESGDARLRYDRTAKKWRWLKNTY